VLLPWPNRIRGGRYRWRGVEQQLDLSDPDTAGAIHGLTRWAPWRVVERTGDAVRLAYVLHACPGWPFVLGCEVDYALGPGGLTVRTTATNLGTAACPYGTGAHPYLHAGAPTVDGAVVVVPADRHLTTDDGGIPTGSATVAGTPFDLRDGQRLGERRLDTTFTALRRGSDGLARVRLTGPTGDATTLWCDPAYRYLQLFTGDALPEPARRRGGLAVEPMTCPPDAFRSGQDLVVLEPGQAHTATWGIDPGTGGA
jgi:aldose 1-epimerase